MSVSLDRDNFRKGVSDALTLRPLREAVRAIVTGKPPSRPVNDPKTGQITLVRSQGGWRERKAS